jgi:hypothetical protein
MLEIEAASCLFAGRENESCLDLQGVYCVPRAHPNDTKINPNLMSQGACSKKWKDNRLHFLCRQLTHRRGSFLATIVMKTRASAQRVVFSFYLLIINKIWMKWKTVALFSVNLAAAAWHWLNLVGLLAA